MFDIESFVQFWQYDAENPLMFTTKGFLLMFTIFYCIYFRIQSRFNLRIVYVTLFSIYFYYLTSGFYFWLLVLISFTDHSIGFFIYNIKTQWKRKLFLILSLSIDLGLLCYFKYTNFMLEIVDNLANRPFEAKNIFLPIGISFYIFQSLSYVIDIYRRQLQPTEKWVDFMFFLSFFPQLVAGPIVRARNFLPQIVSRPITSLPMFNQGLMLILTGLIKKIFIADFIGSNFVDRVFDAPQIYSGFENLMGIYGYALQIYCDFSGYTDMAIGLALLLGFQFPQNFNNPYRAATVTEFWHRWHISLSTWLRDYLYISLGGNRKGRIRTYINLMITMVLGGLWHGASWHFVVWGVIHGFALCAHKLALAIIPGWKQQGNNMKPCNRFVSTFLTFHFICITWIVFRTDNIETIQTLFAQIFQDFDISTLLIIISKQWKVCGIILLGYLLIFMPERSSCQLKKMFYSIPISGKLIISVFVLWAIIQIQTSDIEPFIYFQF